MRDQRLELKTNEAYQPGELTEDPAEPQEVAQLLPQDTEDLHYPGRKMAALRDLAATQQLMHAELALQSTVPRLLPMAWNAVLCLQCPGLHLGSGHQHLPARTPALALSLACLFLPICHLPAPEVPF